MNNALVPLSASKAQNKTDHLLLKEGTDKDAADFNQRFHCQRRQDLEIFYPPNYFLKTLDFAEFR